MKISIVGLGWFGMALGQKLKSEYTVFGSKTKINDQAENGLEVRKLIFDPEPQSDHLEELFDTDVLIFNIPPSGKGELGEYAYSEMIAKTLSLTATFRTGKLIFFSSTGVFGENQHRVSESTTPEPDTANGKVLVDAEQKIMNEFKGTLTIIRPGGLVGGNRHPAKYLAGRQGVSGPRHPVNLVHREDLITLTEEIILNDYDREVFHAVSDQHPEKAVYYTTMAEKFGLAAPEFNQEDQSPGKHVDGSYTKRTTGVHFKYDDPFLMTS